MLDIDKAVEDIVGLEWILAPNEPECERCREILEIGRRSNLWGKYVGGVLLEDIAEDGVPHPYIERRACLVKGESNGDWQS